MTTPLILAIEPDRRQASQLASIARGLSVPLVLVESAARALEALSDRLPDLILTPPLLSRRDDLALAERLRNIGEVGAHIQTLTIPILEVPEPPSRGGMLSALRREKPGAAGPTGCDTNTFSEQIAVYLERAAAARLARAEPPPQGPEVSPANDTAALIRGELFDTTPIPPAPAATADTIERNTAEGHQSDPLDEWSYFDPEQQRFAALLAKLDEIAAEEVTT